MVVNVLSKAYTSISNSAVSVTRHLSTRRHTIIKEVLPKSIWMN